MSKTFKEIADSVKDYGDFEKNGMLYWATALSGETGEACNFIKKIFRDGEDSIDEKTGEKNIDLLPAEIADVFIYIVLMSRHLGFDLEKEIIKKIDIVEKRRENNGT